jgi:hypothetical protein
MAAAARRAGSKAGARVSPGLEMLNELVMQLLVTLIVMTLALCAAAGILALALELLRPAVRRWLARSHPTASFYVGRLEDSRAAVYIVDRDVVRLLFEQTPAPISWAQVGDGVSRRLAADALDVEDPPQRGADRLARKLAKASPDGFVLERRTVAALADRAPRRWALRLGAVAARGGSRLRRALLRGLGPWAYGRGGEARRRPSTARGGRRASA